MMDGGITGSIGGGIFGDIGIIQFFYISLLVLAASCSNRTLINWVRAIPVKNLMEKGVRKYKKIT